MRKLKLYKNKYYLVFYKVDILTLEISWPLAVLSNVAELVRFFELPETLVSISKSKQFKAHYQD